MKCLPLLLSISVLAEAQSFATVPIFVNETGTDIPTRTRTIATRTLIPVGTGNSETTYKYQFIDSTNASLKTMTRTIILSASGFKDIATVVEEECHFTAADSGICVDFAVNDAGVTFSTETETGFKHEIIVPIATTNGVSITQSPTRQTPQPSTDQASPTGSQSTSNPDNAALPTKRNLCGLLGFLSGAIGGVFLILL
ncbi:hypothetical protein Moror_10925 [Moniliophthora roreri MCA 2997]|uniref:Uncharacterized protein n=2 Tax=Moniliophthora roreri TaxID=221103 RepID=V2X3E9_MONRO|nr:hypothetical protein Moror_10925 [Moniliophthora roreri MCA 2997]KAI3613603.1 hypothetical protein WG66_006139 [Moniliophthora roreri]